MKKRALGCDYRRVGFKANQNTGRTITTVIVFWNNAESAIFLRDCTMLTEHHFSSPGSGQDQSSVRIFA
jgi:hypothetical protein